MSEGYQSIHTGADVDNGISATQNAASEETSGVLVKRDAQGRMRAVDPSAAQDVVTKVYADTNYDAVGAAAAVASDLSGHESDTANPHSVTATQVGLGNVDDTADADKPISDAVQAVLDSLAPSYGEIHLHDGVASQTIPNGATYTKLTLWQDNGTYSACTPDAADGKITITRPGRYLVVGNFSFSLSTNLVNILATVFLDGVEQNQIHFKRKVGTGSDVGAAGFSGIIEAFDSGDMDLDVRIRHDYGSNVNLTLIYANLTITYLGE